MIKSAAEAIIFKVGDRVAVIHLHGVGKDREREVVRIDTVEKITSKEVVTDHAKFNAKTGFQVGRPARIYQIAPLAPGHEAELKTRERLAGQQNAEREAILQKREGLHRLFPEKYAPDVSVFNDGKVEIMFKLTYLQAENLARLLKEHDL